MKMIQIQSSNIKYAGWEEGEMELVFQDGGHYRYHEVPQGAYLDFLKSKSKGAYFHKWLKPKYKATNLKPTPV